MHFVVATVKPVAMAFGVQTMQIIYLYQPHSLSVLQVSHISSFCYTRETLMTLEGVDRAVSFSQLFKSNSLLLLAMRSFYSKVCIVFAVTVDPTQLEAAYAMHASCIMHHACGVSRGGFDGGDKSSRCRCFPGLCFVLSALFFHCEQL